MKRIIFATVFIALILCGCSKLPTADVNKRCYDTFSEMNSFVAEVKVTSYSNTNNTEYTATQYFKAPDKMRTESQDLITIVTDRSMCVKNAATGQIVRAEQLPAGDMDYMFLQNIISAYYQGEETTAAMKSQKDTEILTLTVDTGLANPYKATAELKIRAHDMMPLSLEIKGRDGKTYTEIEYLSFEIDKEVADEIFNF
ncbi:MAG: hypothetical protein WCX81_04150 [Monoglobales bacterium]